MTLFTNNENYRENSASSLRCLPSHFRLLQATEAALHHGSLEGIDALLGIISTFDNVW